MKHLFLLIVFICGLTLYQSMGQDLYNIPFENSCKYGLMKEDGSIIFNARYKSIIPLYDTFYKAETPFNKIGVISSNGRIAIPFLYDSIGFAYDYRFEEIKVFVGKLKSKTFYFSLEGKNLKPGAKQQQPGLCGNHDNDEPDSRNIFSTNGRYGLRIPYGTKKDGEMEYEVTAAAIYDTIISINAEGEYFIAKKDNFDGVLNRFGEIMYTFGNYSFDYNKSFGGFVVTDRKSNLKGFFQPSSKSCRTSLVYDSILNVVYPNFILVKRKNACPYYVNCVTGQQYKK